MDCLLAEFQPFADGKHGNMSNNINLRSIFKHGSNAFFAANVKTGRQLPASEPEPANALALGKTSKGKAQIRGRVRVLYTGCFVRPQDADNLAGATKVCTDALRAVRLLQNDDPYSVELSWRQRKVKSFNEERLEIEITKP